MSYVGKPRQKKEYMIQGVSAFELLQKDPRTSCLSGRWERCKWRRESDTGKGTQPIKGVLLNPASIVDNWSL